MSAITGEMADAGWEKYRALVERFYDPGSFATILAYEVSFDSPYGHHNVYFRHNSGPLPLVLMDRNTLPELWKLLKVGEALTIPHHDMKMPAVVDWRGVDRPDFRRNFEIYSGHGLSESYDPDHPLAFESSLFTNPSVTNPNGMSAQKAWAAGFELSTIASSDDHRAHPGQPHYGLAAVRAGSLTREAIFDGLLAKRTYGTTGVRMILEFEINGVPMGGRVQWDGSSPIRLRGRALGTDVVERIEVLRLLQQPSSREVVPGFQVLYDASPAQEDVEFAFEDRELRSDAVYYLRVRQRPLVRERIAMAWSSPIWVKSDRLQR
jgi:hypothetical protein